MEFLGGEVGDEGEMIVHRTARRGSLSMRMMRGRSVVKVRPQSRPAPAPAPMDSTNWVITFDVVTLWPLSAMLRAIAKIARAVPSLRRDSDWRIVRPAGAMPLPRDATAVASVGPRQAPIRSAAPRESPRATPTPAIMPAVIMTRTVADRMMPRSARFMRTSETDRDSQYRMNGRKIVRTIVGESEASETPGMNEAPAPAAMRSTGPIRLNLLVRRMQHTAAIPRTMIASTVMVPLSDGILL